jgi:hypothetical protein
MPRMSVPEEYCHVDMLFFLVAFAAIPCWMPIMHTCCTFLNRDSISCKWFGADGMEGILKALKHNTALTKLTYANQLHFPHTFYTSTSKGADTLFDSTHPAVNITQCLRVENYEKPLPPVVALQTARAMEASPWLRVK